MKKRGIIVYLLFISLMGCQYLEDPKSFFRDPHFTAYQEKRDALEREYLQKKISYDEYYNRRNELDEQYSKEVQEREDKIKSD